MGDAHELMAEIEGRGPYDLAFVDADKSGYLPRMNANPSDCASRFLISTADSLSPSRVTSIRKSSNALSPSCAGALPPTVALTCGRAGRFMRQFAGIRTNAPSDRNQNFTETGLQISLAMPESRPRNFDFSSYPRLNAVDRSSVA
jgi:hypothetical protein